MRFLLSYFLIFSLMLGSSKILAQLSEGSISPDFTISDIEGTSYNLYDILDEGKIVILDFFTTWCGPCWSYAQSKELEKIWQQYGPQGNDELFIFYVEHDPYTTLDDLRGIGSNTYGDFTAGITYPVFNTASLNNPYEVSYVPTVYMICPNKRIREIGQITFKEAKKLIPVSCSPPLGEDNGEILVFESNLDPFCQFEKYSPEIRFQNAGNNDILSARFDVFINGQISHADCLWTGSLPPFETAVVEFNSVNLSEEIEIEVRIKDINGEVDDTPPNNKITGIKLTPKARTQPLIVEVKTDKFGFETYWQILDENGELIADGGNDYAKAGAGQTVPYLQSNPHGYYQSDTLYTHQVFLPNTACYEFNIIDDFGDGICCAFGDGYFRVKDASGNIIIEGSQRFSQTISPFENVGVLSTSSVNSALNFNLFPNPAKLQISVRISGFEVAPGPGIIKIINTLGQQLIPSQHFQHSGHSFQQDMNISTLSPGIYFLQLEIGKQISMQKFFVE